MEAAPATTSSPRRRRQRVSVNKLVDMFEGAPQEVDGMFLKPVAHIQDFTVFTAQRRGKLGGHSKARSEAGSECGSELDERGSSCATTNVPSGDEEDQPPRAKTPRARVPPLRFVPRVDEAKEECWETAAACVHDLTKNDSPRAKGCAVPHVGRVLRVEEAEEECINELDKLFFDFLVEEKNTMLALAAAASESDSPCPDLADHGRARADRYPHSFNEVMALAVPSGVPSFDPTLARLVWAYPGAFSKAAGGNTRRLFETVATTKDSVQELTSSPQTRVVLLSAAGGGAACGSVGAAVGCASGGTLGALCGLVVAPLTLGASIPIGALAGSCTGLFAGAVGGSTAGGIGGGVLGLVGYRCHESGVFSVASRALPRFYLGNTEAAKEA